MFKNESDFVARRAELRYKELAKAKESDATSSDGSSTEEHQTKTRSVVQVARNLSNQSLASTLIPSSEDQAIGFFLTYYVMKPKLVPRGELDFLPDLLSLPGNDRILQTSVMAAGLACLGNSKQSPKILAKARENYISALSMTNQALRSPRTIRKDSTLLAVIVLGIYENAMSGDKSQWRKHVEGACALINLRGPQSLRHSVGLRMFQQYYANILLSSFENRMEIPAGMNELYETGSGIYDYNVHGREWTTRIVVFMRDVIILNSQQTDNHAGRLRIAIGLEKELADILSFKTGIWNFVTVRLGAPSEFVAESLYHVYTDPWITYMWNNLRSCEFALHKIILQEFAHTSPANLPFKGDELMKQVSSSKQAVQRIATDIRASLPQITGQLPFPTSLPTETAVISTMKLYPPGTFLAFRTPTCLHHIIWPLYEASRFECSDEMREWAIGRLHWVGVQVGHKQGIALAEELQALQSHGRETKTEGVVLRQLPSLPIGRSVTTKKKMDV